MHPTPGVSISPQSVVETLNYLACKVSLTPRYYSAITSVLLNKCTVDMLRRQTNVLNMTGNGRTLCTTTVISEQNSVTTTPKIEQYTWDTERVHSKTSYPYSSSSPWFVEVASIRRRF